MSLSCRLLANPMIVLREEFDDWALLFDPDTHNTFGLNPVSVFIYKKLDGRHTLAEIVSELRLVCPSAPEDVERYVETFFDNLVSNGLAGCIPDSE